MPRFEWLEPSPFDVEFGYQCGKCVILDQFIAGKTFKIVNGFLVDAGRVGRSRMVSSLTRLTLRTARLPFMGCSDIDEASDKRTNFYAAG